MGVGEVGLYQHILCSFPREVDAELLHLVGIHLSLKN